MAINSQQFKTLLGCHDIFSKIEFNYETIEKLDDLRKYHIKYKADLSYHRVYPRASLQEAEKYKICIEELCTEIGLNVYFYLPHEDNYRQNIFCNYMFEDINITKIIDL